MDIEQQSIKATKHHLNNIKRLEDAGEIFKTFIKLHKKCKDKTLPEEKLRKAERKTNKILKSCGIDTKELEDKTEE